jgi:penicillin-binding protein 1A
MMTEMMKTVLYSGTGRDAYISWLLQAGKTGTSNYTDEEIENHIKTSQFVAPDEMFVGYTRKYSMAVWTGYSNRLTPIVGDGFTVATSIYRSMMQYLAEDDHPGDWTMPEGLYRSGDYVFKNGARSNWIFQTTQQSSTTSSSTTENQNSVAETTSPNAAQNPTAPNTNQNPQ